MPALFSRSWDVGLRVGLGLVAVLVVGTLIFLMVLVRTPYANEQFDPYDQPVQFDHRHHVRDEAIDCLFCHYGAERSRYAGVPPVSLCMGCHGQIWNEAALLEAVRTSYYDNLPLEWRRVHQLADFAYFDHSAHVLRGVGCVSCHGRVDLMPRVYKVYSMNMGWCLECHRDPAPHLRPLHAVTDMEWTPEESPRQIGERILERLDIQPPLNCSGCHR